MKIQHCFHPGENLNPQYTRETHEDPSASFPNYHGPESRSFLGAMILASNVSNIVMAVIKHICVI